MRTRVSVCLCAYARGDGSSTVCAVVPRARVPAFCAHPGMLACALIIAGSLELLLPFLPNTDLRIVEAEPGHKGKTWDQVCKEAGKGLDDSTSSVV